MTFIEHRVDIVETTVAGVKAWHAECAEHQWRCHKKPHGTNKVAVRCGNRHLGI